jgi:spore maturation protein CgeB
VALRSVKTPVAVSVPNSPPDAERPLPEKRTPPTTLKELRVAAILDTFTQSCFEPECELLRFRPDNWQDILSTSPPDLLFVESAWNGNDGAWQYRIAEYAAPLGHELQDVLAWCKRVGIPTIFWNKEDPPHFDDFIKSACLFDWIFTTDANCIQKYKDRCGHERVFALPFAAQPAIHNPILRGPRNDRLCFAGTYYGDRFDARRSAMEILLRPALDFDFDIYDRMHGAVGPGTENYRFPDEYKPHIVGRLDYGDMVDAYRRYRAFLNVNSVADSETMFSRRVFELLACGTPVVSTESLGIRKMLPDIVPIARDAEEAHDAIAELLTDDRSWRRRSALGIRRVMRAHTYAHRLRQVCETVGLRLTPPRPPSVTVAVLPGPNPAETSAQLIAQTRKPDRILLVRNSNADALEEAIRRFDSSSRAQIVDDLSGAIGRDAGVVVAFIDGNNTYGVHYLDDALLALDYSQAASTSMTAHFELTDDASIDHVTDLGEANVMSRRVMRACFVARADVLSPAFLDSILSKKVLELGTDCFARNPFEFLAGAALELTDKRIIDFTLEESDGVANS